MLALENVGVRYGGVDALKDVSLTVEPSRVLGLIGPNGAGKTTLVNATTGLAPLATGKISLDGSRINSLPPHLIARAGIARTYQNIRLFGALSVADNVRAGAYRRKGLLSREAVRKLLANASVDHLDLDRAAGTLAYGEQRRLEIARALAARPAVLLLDEPAAGSSSIRTFGAAASARAISSRR